MDSDYHLTPLEIISKKTRALSDITQATEFQAIDLEFDCYEPSQLVNTTKQDPFQIDIENIPDTELVNENDDELSSLVSYIENPSKENVSDYVSSLSVRFDLLSKKRYDLYDVAGFDQTCPGSIFLDAEFTERNQYKYKEKFFIERSSIKDNRFCEFKSKFTKR